MPPPPRPVDLVVHIGTDKTGTTSIQGFLRHNRRELAARGCLVPRSPGTTRHIRVGMFIMPDDDLVASQDWFRGDYGDLPVDEFRQQFRRRIFREMREAEPTRMVLTDEALFPAPPVRLKRLRRFADRIARSTRVVVYLRRQDDHLISLYQQHVKRGQTQRLGAWAQQDRAPFYDYHRRLSAWRDHLGPDALVARPFERSGFVGGDLVDDFIAAADLGQVATGLEKIGTRNESLNADSVEFLRLLNLHQVEDLGMHPWQIRNRQHVVRLQGLPGPILTLPAAEHAAFGARWEEANAAVARDFLADPADRLFTKGPRTEGTTAEQRLDPARLDDFFTLLEIPEETQGPLRRLAEREAKA